MVPNRNCATIVSCQDISVVTVQNSRQIKRKKQGASKHEKQQKTKLCTDESESCFAASVDDGDYLWCLDSGASAHMTNNVDLLADLEESSNGTGRNCQLEVEVEPAKSSR